MKADPAATLRALAKEVTASLPTPAFVSDAWTYRFVVIALGIVAAAAVLGATYLEAVSTSPVTIPDVLTALYAASMGDLAGLLAPSPGR